MGPVKSVSAMARTLVRNIEVEDTAVAILEFENGALGQIVGTTSVTPGYARTIEICGDKGSIMSSIVDENRPTKMTDAVEVDVIDDAILVLHIIVHGLWDDKIRELTLPLIEEVCAKWGIGYKILADYFDVEKSIAHHELPGQ
jgi:hypothetical protein